MPQTVEAINHAKAANTPIIVAINKIDKEGANPDRVKQELMKYDLVPEDYGGDTICVPVSAKKGIGIEDLLENVVLEADVMELKANQNRSAYGVVIEAELDKGRGSVARLLVQKGTLHQGDVVAVGSAYGKVRAMTDDKGRRIKKAGPSQPCEILGLNTVPNAGEIFQVKDSEKEAKAYAAAFVTENKQKMVEESKKKVSLDALFDQIKAGEIKELPIVVKADVQGSVEAVKDSLEKIKNDEVAVKVIHSGVGAINESDVVLASASNAIVIGFDVKPDATAKEIAEREHVDVRLYNIIYKAIEDIEDAMKGMLAPVYEEKVIGHAEIRQIFKASGVGNIAGCMVKDGLVQRGAKARIMRGPKQDLVFEGEIASVKRFKDDVKEVKAGYECGLVFEAFNEIEIDDYVEVYVMEEVKR
jgi:translation initiation factor IF-2